jgi:hypothetical protein
MTLCACGKPLHYTNPDTQATVEGFIARLGETILVRVRDRAWNVPRHYLALHGLAAQQLPTLALELGFEEQDLHGIREDS